MKIADMVQLCDEAAHPDTSDKRTLDISLKLLNKLPKLVHIAKLAKQRNAIKPTIELTEALKELEGE